MHFRKRESKGYCVENSEIKKEGKDLSRRKCTCNERLRETERGIEKKMESARKRNYGEKQVDTRKIDRVVES